MRESEELRAVIARAIHAAQQRDGATLANMFCRSAATRYIGTDPEEWWNGVGFVDAFPNHVAKWPPLKLEVLEIEAFEAWDTGWGACRTLATFGDAEPAPVRFTFVFVLEAGIWRLTQMHCSRATPNVEWVGVELTGSLENLLASIERGSSPGLPVRDGTVSLVFTDIEDSTQMAAQFGDSVWIDALHRHHQATEGIITPRGGTVIKTLGDGAMIAFASTREAVRSAIEIQRHHAGSAGPVAMRIRIGVHVGDAVASEGDYLGTTVNKAARIAAAAEGGQIMVSEAVRVLLGDSREFVLGEAVSMKLRGLDGVHEVTPVLWDVPLGGT